DVVDARLRGARARIEEVGAPGEARRDLTELTGLALPEAANAVAVAIVPLGEARWKAAEAVAVGAHVPGLGDPLQAREGRVGGEAREEAAREVDAVRSAGERRRQVEAEPVDVHLLDQIAQARHDEVERLRMLEVQRVAARRDVEVAARVARVEPIVG